MQPGFLPPGVDRLPCFKNLYSEREKKCSIEIERGWNGMWMIGWSGNKPIPLAMAWVLFPLQDSHAIAIAWCWQGHRSGWLLCSEANWSGQISWLSSDYFIPRPVLSWLERSQPLKCPMYLYDQRQHQPTPQWAHIYTSNTLNNPEQPGLLNIHK
jgi:hypothetical protein